MAWDTAKTKRLLLEAAVDEFAAHGPEGGRIDRIAAAAGVNKERIYPYFGGKRQLFDAVVQRELEQLAAAVPMEEADGRPVDLPEYAGRVFDYHLAHPHLLRLLQWEALYGDATAPVAGEERRAAYYAEKVAAASRARRTEAGSAQAADSLPPKELLYAVVALAGWQFAVPQLARMITGGTVDEDPAARRAAVVDMVRRLAL
ncbi:TetR/AcrR family transcriptional regulator [Streptomyces kaniharaensis]|uniref:TetR/AcrR family transcriptional regulator n=1 Tax=Streptomyces kaniharaensis TaxID=212423 RepID=A0A6N7KVB9_9ACTN|nr:TetR family transcriptional regulator [Streptomyces kaniharaensis]MQS15582.1 TetR/AcrR family transcriptional regulator [Streptomyces kaniharaensis]